jgi:hypothetical protein
MFRLAGAIGELKLSVRVTNLDTGLFRNFSLSEHWKLQVRAESFNLTNTPHFVNPSANVSNLSLNSNGTIRSLGNFMAVTSTATGSTNAEGGRAQHSARSPHNVLR